jgi:Ca-activated chloride channel family protein
MSFHTPAYLVALVIVPLVIAAYLVAQRRRQRYAVRFAALDTLASVAPRSPGWRRHLPAALLCLALAALAVALARPQASVAVSTRNADIMLVTDVSTSMAATDVAPNRLAAAQKAAGTFIDKLPRGIKVGAVAFSNQALTIARPTDNHSQVKGGILALRAAGGTATGNGIQAALNALRQPNAKQRTPSAIVLLSDGKATSGIDPIAQAQAARKAKIPIYTVALGTPGGTLTVPGPLGVPQSVPVPPDPEALRQIAQTSGGRAFTAADDRKLSTIYQKLSSRIASHKEKREITAGFAGGALVLVLLAGLLSMRWFGRLP